MSNCFYCITYEPRIALDSGACGSVGKGGSDELVIRLSVLSTGHYPLSTDLSKTFS